MVKNIAKTILTADVSIRLVAIITVAAIAKTIGCIVEKKQNSKQKAK